MMLIQEPVHAAIWHCLNHYAYADATFLSERLFCEVGSDESLHLLATCYYRSGKTNQAYNLLSSQGARTPQNKFLLAKCCADLNKLSEAESLFPNFDGTSRNGNKDTLSEEVIAQFGDSGSFALQILAQILAASERGTQAIQAERKALKLNPFLWKSFESLCQRGDNPDPAAIFNIANVDNFVQCQGLNPILQYANSFALPQIIANSQQGNAPAAAPATTAAPNTHHFAPHISSVSVTSTPITGSNPHSSVHIPQQQPAKPFLHPGNVTTVEATPQPSGLPVPQLMMSMITPVHNQLESTLGGYDACFTGSPMTDTSRMISGIGTLNMSTDVESSSHFMIGRADGNPPPAPQLGRRKRLPPLSSNITGNASFLNVTGKTGGVPILNLNRFLNLEYSGGADAAGQAEGSFGVLPHGTLSWSNQGVRINPDGPGRTGGAVKLDFSSLAILSPFAGGAASIGQDGGLSASTPANAAMMSSPMSNGGQQARIDALGNSTNNELKLSKRGLTESNSMKLNVFTPSSQNNTNNIQNVTPFMSGAGGGGGGALGGSALNATGANLSNTGSIQNVRRSSRLFVSSQQSKQSKENSKGVTAAPAKASRLLRSPSRKSSKTTTSSSNRFVSTPQSAVDMAAEKNEKNKEKLKKDHAASMISSSTATLTPMSMMGGGSGSAQVMSDQTAQILNAQALVIQRHCVEGLLNLMRQFGSAYYELSRYNCRKAIALLEDVPSKHRRAGWALGHLGKAHFELGQYKEAKRYFENLRDVDPYRMEFMEYYSTALWHLQEEVELSALAQELTRLDKFSPQAWCTAGNCFSHQKEHENSIKFFNRAIQVDPNFAYAYTLLGHEYVMIEELEKALSCFRAAVRVDPRHYNAWYGIGLTYYKQERFQLAEFYYRKALNINPQSPILMCHVAVVQHALQKTDKALETLQLAIEAAPQNPLCKFEKASILFSSERYHEALLELNELKTLAPKESPVYFLIGKVHNKLNNTHLALMHFSWAMDLDPKVANSQIKDALDPTLNRVAQEDSAPMDDTLLVEDLEVEGVDQTEEDVVMVQEESPNLAFQDDLNASSSPTRGSDETPPPRRASTPPAPRVPPASSSTDTPRLSSDPATLDDSL